MIKVLFFILISFSLFACGENQCISDYEVKQSTIEKMNEIKKLNNYLVHNLKPLKDSCCKHVGCDDSNALYPLNLNLLKKYLPVPNNVGVELLMNLSSPIQNNEDPLLGPIKFKYDSTIIYKVYKKRCDDIIVDHLLIFKKGQYFMNNNFEYDTIIVHKIDSLWEYRILEYKYSF